MSPRPTLGPIPRLCDHCHTFIGFIYGRGKNSPRYCSASCRTQAYYLRNPTMRRRPKNRKELKA